jgi:hypothetical protein
MRIYYSEQRSVLEGARRSFQGPLERLCHNIPPKRQPLSHKRLLQPFVFLQSENKQLCACEAMRRLAPSRGK